MPQTFDPLPSDSAGSIVCCYVNATSRIQIARIANVPNWYFERVVFPGQRLVFETVSDAMLEIHSGAMASAILSDTIACTRLRVHDDLNPAPNPVEQQQIEERNDSLDTKPATPAAVTL
ncbi:DUF1830 domain-containing protein [Leptolyngbya sp. FACHB-36]|uniref:DUF1830 domain-containing protein n=1 Tax=Leptolyngbya sp. FACHB-36 TaxID=2692808 RepID=UPI001680C13B|nr:DUF1830 domain-containing protein [Leptolyngbya sp. FACHB-36]MBD2020154.1 DUF1830 domain-containing protein [Leptolyngbya sp. FACHB-36]